MATMTHDTPVRSRLGNGLLLAALSASSFGLSGALARGLLNAGWSPAAVVIVRVLLGAAVLLPVAVVQLHGNWGLLRRNIPLLTGYGLLAVAGAQLAYFNAVAYMDVGVALLIEYTAPIAVVVWLWLRHEQKPGRATVLGALIGIAGLVLVLDLRSDVPTSWIGVLWALGAMVGAAAYFIMSGSAGEAVPGTVLATSGLLIGGFGILIAGLAGIVPLHATTNPVAFQGFTAQWWQPLLALGVITASLAYVSGIAATRMLGSRLASFAALTEVLAAILFAWALLGQAPHAIQLLGGILILAGVVVVRLGEPQENPADPTLSEPH
ncbi:EamA family transporter [Nocardia sp. SYP-A9097]|uniref:EamA family transporter n=1 Tax=Nocardia sp. SYP-A9097 TaxID=2663237 RepID=UPI00129BBAAA|nr:DMT family transporter [Nocardia sp. SYP-A9097]MRH87050.1 EamA family transporter [Nocardia sp. SYP-A9097]